MTKIIEGQENLEISLAVISNQVVMRFSAKDLIANAKKCEDSDVMAIEVFLDPDAALNVASSIAHKALSIKASM